MSEYSEVELPFLRQLAAQGWMVVDQGCVTHDEAQTARCARQLRLAQGKLSAG